MEFKKRKLIGTYEITLNPKGDERGFFMRTFDDLIFNKRNIKRKWVQENHSSSKQKGIIRGLHFQLPPYSETKMVRCIRGSVLDVFVDLRKDSSTFGQWDAIELSEENRKMIFIPSGFAHGFCTLTERSDVLYKVDNYYTPKSEKGLLWNDEDININWPINNPILSEKDKNNLSLKEFLNQYSTVDFHNTSS